MKSIALLLALLIVLASASVFENKQDYALLFKSWMRDNKKSYSHDEFFHRLEIFTAAVDKVVAHNSRADSTYRMGLNKFADLTHEEFMRYYVGPPMKIPQNLQSTGRIEHANVVPANDIDWTTRGAVTGVKDQGQCGSCYSFGASGAIEGAGAVQGMGLNSLSEQQIVDCSGDYGNEGCNGGLQTQAFQYVIAHGGLCSEDAYGYEAAQGQCRDDQCDVVTSSMIQGFVQLNSRTENELQQALNIKPVTVAVEADQEGFQYYTSGVFSGACGTNLDHAVLAVGYGTMSGKMYWKVKNSWGPGWGQDGYIYLIRHGGSGPGQCGIAMMASYATF